MMTSFVFFLSLITSTIAAPPLGSGSSALELKFQNYMLTFNKAYDTEAETSAAFKAFTSNDAIILEHNAKNASFKLGHNEFSDLTWGQFSKVFVGGFDAQKHLSSRKNYDPSLTTRVPNLSDAVDWVAKGAVTPIKNQQQCGSCWAFSTTGAVEGALKVATGSLLSLSEQQLVSCDHGGDEGCKGGSMDTAFGWIEKHGLCSETDYPYTSGDGVDGTCKTTCKPLVTLTGFADVPKGDESALINAISIGPVSVAIEADKSAFQMYKSGVLDSESCGNKLDHGVLIVGYGTDSGKDYYRVKNSWGPSWGESGYIRMVRNKDMCGIADMASYPTGVTNTGPIPTPPPPTPAPPTPAPGPAPSPASGCKFPAVQSCYTASLQTCWTPFSKDKNNLTVAALAALSDQTVAAGIRKILVGGATWKDTWTAETVGEYVYLTAYTFQTYDFLQQYQFAQATLQLSGSKDPKALDAFNKITDQFDGVFYNRAGCGVNNTATLAVTVV
jgi:C1A family cysteine protease